MIIEQTRDIEEIKRVMGHPEIYDRISCDGAPSIEDFSPDVDNEVYLAGYVNESLVGIINVHDISEACWEIHIQVLPEQRKYAHEFGQKCIEWVWSNTSCKKLVAQIPSIYLDVIDFAKSKGFKVEGVNEKSYMKYNVLLDQIYMGLCHG